jgi:hypothetical protein
MKPLTRADARRATLRDFDLPVGLGSLAELQSELQDMIDVLLGRRPPPLHKGTLTLMEVADAYHARAQEIRFLLYQGEMDGKFKRGGPANKFRTGQLQAFIDLVKATQSLGSRRLTAEQVHVESARLGRDLR